MPIDMSAATKAPPARANRKPTTQKSAPARIAAPSNAEARYDGLMGLGSLGQGICFMAKQYAQAATFGKHWAPVAKELAVLADSQPVVAKYTDLLITAGPYVGLVQALVPFTMQTLANYGFINAENAGGGSVVAPAVLEAEMKAEMARMQTEALRAQREAMREAAAAQAEWDALVAENAPQTDRVNGYDPAAVSQ